MSRATLEVPADDEISLTLSKFQPEDLLNVIQGLKKVVDVDPSQAREMLVSNPDLAYAVLQAQFLMGLIDEEVVATAMKNTQDAEAGSRAGSEPPAVSEPPADPVLANGSEPATTKEPQQIETSTSEEKNKSSTPDDPFQNMAPEQAAMLRQILAISPEQLVLLPAEQQEQVRNLKAQYGLI